MYSDIPSLVYLTTAIPPVRSPLSVVLASQIPFSNAGGIYIDAKAIPPNMNVLLEAPVASPHIFTAERMRTFFQSCLSNKREHWSETGHGRPVKAIAGNLSIHYSVTT